MPNPVQGLAIMGNMSKIKTVTDFAESLRSQHSSASIDYRKKFGIKAATDPIQTVIDRSNGAGGQGEMKYYCFKCRKAIPDNVARFCWNNKERFGGKAFCYECQTGTTCACGTGKKTA